MTSAVNWALLGLVISRESYGYELAQRFERNYGDIQAVSDSQLYKALNQLALRGLIEEVPGSETGRQPRLHYRATQLGLTQYEDWLVEQVDVESRRQELWVRQLSVFAQNPAAAVQLLDRFERAYLRRSGQVGRPSPLAQIGPRFELVERLVAEQHRIAIGGMLTWLRRARDWFEALAKESGAGGPS